MSGRKMPPSNMGFSPKQIIIVAKANVLFHYSLHGVNMPAVGRRRGYSSFIFCVR